MLSVQNLSKVYSDGTPALKNISFHVEKGEFAVILGKSGAGKSTLLRCLNQLIAPTEGKIYIAGKEIKGGDFKQLQKVRKKMGMIFQNYNLVKESSVLANVLSGRLGYLSNWKSLLGC